MLECLMRDVYKVGAGRVALGPRRPETPSAVPLLAKNGLRSLYVIAIHIILNQSFVLNMDGIPQLRIASLNIHGWRDRNGKLNRLRVKEELQRINADIIALQEVKSPFPISNAKTSQEETGTIFRTRELLRLTSFINN